MTTIPIGNPGQAGDAFESFTQFDLLLSDTPVFFTTVETIAVGHDVPLYQVLVRDPNQIQVRPALNATDLQYAFGIAASAVVTTASAKTIQVIRGGHFNGDKLVWPPGLSDAEKLTAFTESEGPTQIVIDFNRYHRAP